MYIIFFVKTIGCTVIGFAGTDEKCQLLINKYGFDKAYNYKKVSKSIILNLLWSPTPYSVQKQEIYSHLKIFRENSYSLNNYTQKISWNQLHYAPDFFKVWR